MKKNNEKKPPYNWIKIENDYVTNPSQTYDSLGEKYGPRPNAISRHAQEGKWREKRQAFQEQTMRKTQEKLVEMKAKEEVTEIEKMCKAVFESLQGVKYLADKKIVADVERIKNGQPGLLSVKEIQSLANAQKLVQDSQRIAKGLSDKDLNVNLVYKQLAPILEKVVSIIEKHAPQTREIIAKELDALFGANVC